MARFLTSIAVIRCGTGRGHVASTTTFPASEGDGACGWGGSTREWWGRPRSSFVGRYKALGGSSRGICAVETRGSNSRAWFLMVYKQGSFRKGKIGVYGAGGGRFFIRIRGVRVVFH